MARERSRTPSPHTHPHLVAEHLEYDQPLSKGRVHRLPMASAATSPPSFAEEEEGDEGRRREERYEGAVMRRAAKLTLPPEQEYMRMGIARSLTKEEEVGPMESLLELVRGQARMF